MKKANPSNTGSHNKAAAHGKPRMAYITVITRRQTNSETILQWDSQVGIFAFRPRIPEQWGKSKGLHQRFSPQKPRVPFQKRPTNRPVRLVYKLPDPLLETAFAMYRDVFGTSMKLWASAPKFPNAPDDRHSCVPANSLQMPRVLGSSRKLTSRGIPSNVMLLPGYRTLRPFEEFTLTAAFKSLISSTGACFWSSISSTGTFTGSSVHRIYIFTSTRDHSMIAGSRQFKAWSHSILIWKNTLWLEASHG